MAALNDRGDKKPAVERDPDEDVDDGAGAPQVGAESPPPERDLAGALHEVSNALTVILGWIDQARSDSGPGALGALDIAAFRARQARHIIRRAIGADVPEDPHRSVEAVVGDAATGLDPEARRLGVKIESSVSAAAGDALIGQGSIALQILTNLLLNALAVSPRGASVRVDASDVGGGFVVIGVDDQGPGISPSRRATLFDAGVSTRAGGAGIGLRHAAALARNAGGDLSLARSSGGARFELRWPRAAASSGRRPASAASAPVGLSGSRILLVEDDDAVIDLLDTALTARGAIIVSAKTDAALRDAVDAGRFDAVLLDISPIRGDLEGAFDAIRRSSPSARLVVISGSASQPPSLPLTTEARWVRKPFEIREIVDALAK